MNTQYFAIGLGTQELMIVLVIVLVLFGGKKIPELLRGVGKGVGELQKGLEEGKRQLNSSIHEDESSSIANKDKADQQTTVPH